MIVVRETKDGKIERLSGNPTLTSLDGQVRAPLRTILHESWSAEDRAKFGVYLVEPATVPDGKRAKGSPTYQKQGGVVVEVVELEDMPAPTPGRYELLRADLEALAARVAALEKGARR